MARNVVAQQKKQRKREARERSGLRVKHTLGKKATSGPARTGKAARKALKAQRRNQAASQASPVCLVSVGRRTTPVNKYFFMAIHRRVCV